MNIKQQDPFENHSYRQLCIHKNLTDGYTNPEERGIPDSHPGYNAEGGHKSRSKARFLSLATHQNHYSKR